MPLLNTQDKALQAAAFRAGVRTFEQTLSAGIGVGTVGGLAIGYSVSSQGQVSFMFTWQTLLAAVGFPLASAILAGFRAYLSMASSGLPPQYLEAAKKIIAEQPVEPTPEHAAIDAAQQVLSAVAEQQILSATGTASQQGQAPRS